MKKAVIITTAGERRVVDFDKNTCYRTLSDAVGGLIECVYLPQSLKLDLWVNEEGKIVGLEPNRLATALWTANYGMTDLVVGDVAFTSGTDRHGNTLGLNAEQVSFLMTGSLYDFMSRSSVPA